MKRMQFVLAAVALFTACGPVTTTIDQRSDEEIVLENIHERRSVRNFESTTVEKEKIDNLLRAGMAAPSGRDSRPWEIIVVDDRAVLDSMATLLPYAKMLEEAPLAFVVCGRADRSEYWYVDCSAMTQNILLAAQAMGLGAVWTAAYPYPDRMNAVTDIMSLPENVLPLNVIPIGYPKGDHQPKDKFNEARIHYNKW